MLVKAKNCLQMWLSACFDRHVKYNNIEQIPTNLYQIQRYTNKQQEHSYLIQTVAIMFDRVYTVSPCSIPWAFFACILAPASISMNVISVKLNIAACKIQGSNISTSNDNSVICITKSTNSKLSTGKQGHKDPGGHVEKGPYQMKQWHALFVKVISIQSLKTIPIITYTIKWG